MLFTKLESQHWAEYYGKDWREFVDYDKFWESLFVAYKGKNVPLPLLPDTQTVWKLLKRLKCEPKCGKCCHYGQVLVTPYDIARITSSPAASKVDLTKHLQAMDDGSINLISTPNCPFLLDLECSIYECRPLTCFLFPLQCGEKQQLSIRLLCNPALDLARKVVVDAMAEGGKILLPDLTIIQEV